MAGGQKSKSKKMGRMKKKCELYKKSLTREKNKVRKILKHLKSHPKSEAAITALRRLNTINVGLIRRARITELAEACKAARTA
jgi:hypothetical protein